MAVESATRIYQYPVFRLDLPGVGAGGDGGDNDQAVYYLTTFRGEDVQALCEVLSMEGEVGDWLVSVPKPYVPS